MGSGCFGGFSWLYFGIDDVERPMLVRKLPLKWLVAQGEGKMEKWRVSPRTIQVREDLWKRLRRKDSALPSAPWTGCSCKRAVVAGSACQRAGGKSH